MTMKKLHIREKNKMNTQETKTQEKKQYEHVIKVSKAWLTEYNELYGKLDDTHYVASYKQVLDYILGVNCNLLLCNDIVNLQDEQLDADIYDASYDEEEDRYKDIYQFFLCNVSEFDIDINNELGTPLLLGYCDTLDVDVLMVDHFGTGWDYVGTDVVLEIRE